MQSAQISSSDNRLGGGHVYADQLKTGTHSILQQAVVNWSKAGWKSFRSSKFQDAASSLGRAAALSPSDSQTYRVFEAISHVYLGTQHHQKRDFEAAVKEYSKAIQLDKSTNKKLRGKNFSFLFAEKRSVFEWDRNIAVAYRNRGKINAIIEEYQAAIDDLKVASILHTNQRDNDNEVIVQSYLKLSDVKIKQRDFKSATTALDAAVALKPSLRTTISTQRLTIAVGVGQQLIKADDFKAALRSFDAALAIKADSIAAHRGRADVLEATNAQMDAVSEFATLMKLDPIRTTRYANRSASIQAMMAWAAFKKSAYQEARKLMLPAAKLAPQHKNSLMAFTALCDFELAKELIDNEKLDQAEKHLTQIVMLQSQLKLRGKLITYPFGDSPSVIDCDATTAQTLTICGDVSRSCQTRSEPRSETPRDLRVGEVGAIRE